MGNYLTTTRTTRKRRMASSSMRLLVSLLAFVSVAFIAYYYTAHAHARIPTAADLKYKQQQAKDYVKDAAQDNMNYAYYKAKDAGQFAKEEAEGAKDKIFDAMKGTGEFAYDMAKD